MLASLALYAAAKASLVVLISWDGAPNYIVQRMLRENKLPGVQRLVSKGWIADGSVTVYPSKTAVSHMAVFSGCNPGKNGVSDNAIPLLPRQDHTLLESRSGFHAEAHKVDPLWVWAAAHGKKVLALSAAGTFPPEPDVLRLKAQGIPLDQYEQYSGFEASIQDGRLWQGKGSSGLQIALGEQTFLLRPIKSRGVYNSIEISSDGQRGYVLHKPEGALEAWSKSFWVTKGRLTAPVQFRLWKMDGVTGDFEAYQWKANGMQGTQTPEENKIYLESYLFHDSLGDYTKGGLGPTCWQGGDGTAERRELEIIRKDCQQLKKSFRWGLAKNPDLLFHYTPVIDSLGHMIFGALDKRSSAYNSSAAPKLTAFYEEAMMAVDDWLLDMEAAAPEATFVLFSDHGMQGISRYVSINSILEEAGLYRAENGVCDLSKTLALAPAASDFHVRINTTDWKGGCVELKDKEEVIKRAVKALLDFRDPETGRRPIVKCFWGGALERKGLADPICGDIYFDLADDYYPKSGWSPNPVVKLDPQLGAGVHGFDPHRETMQALLAMGGPGVKPRGRLGRTRHIDIFPTVCEILGIPSPDWIDGRAIR